MIQPQGAPLTALVVEDEPAIAEFLSLVLRDMGLQIRATASAEEAIRWVQQNSFALALLDFQIRGGTGMDVALALRARSAATPILFMSGSWTPEQRRAAQAIPNAVIRDKPLDLVPLQEAIRGLLKA